MSIKSILCIFGGSEAELNAVNTAFLLGKLHGAHIRLLHVSPNPAAYAGVYGEGVFATATIIEAIEKENAERAKKAKQHVTQLAARHHVPLDVPESPAHHASSKFVHLTGLVDDFIAREGRLSDLIIIGREKQPVRDLITPALFETGRLVLLMPQVRGELKEWQDQTVALAWDGGLPAARALYHALPLMKNAEKLHVLVSREHSKPFDLEAETRLLEYLRTHGLRANVVVTERDYHSIAEALLGKTKEIKADLLVMGAYGHSQFREMILGGVTEHMLEHAEIPLLLSH